MYSSSFVHLLRVGIDGIVCNWIDNGVGCLVLCFLASKRLIASESLSDLSYGPKRVKAGSTWDVDSPRITPPGTPPPPYGCSSAAISEGLETASQMEEDGGTVGEVRIWHSRGTDLTLCKWVRSVWCKEYWQTALWFLLRTKLVIMDKVYWNLNAKFIGKRV